MEDGEAYVKHEDPRQDGTEVNPLPRFPMIVGDHESLALPFQISRHFCASQLMRIMAAGPIRGQRGRDSPWSARSAQLRYVVGSERIPWPTSASLLPPVAPRELRRVLLTGRPLVVRRCSTGRGTQESLDELVLRRILHRTLRRPAEKTGERPVAVRLSTRMASAAAE